MQRRGTIEEVPQKRRVDRKVVHVELFGKNRHLGSSGGNVKLTFNEMHGVDGEMGSVRPNPEGSPLTLGDIVSGENGCVLGGIVDRHRA